LSTRVPSAAIFCCSAASWQRLLAERVRLHNELERRIHELEETSMLASIRDDVSASPEYALSAANHRGGATQPDACKMPE